MCLLVQHGGHKLDATAETQRLCSGLGQDFGKEPFSTIDLAREHVVTKNDSWVIDKPVTEHVLHFSFKMKPLAAVDKMFLASACAQSVFFKMSRACPCKMSLDPNRIHSLGRALVLCTAGGPIPSQQ